MITGQILGYRRVTAWLRHREGIVVNHKKVLKVMKGHELLVNQKVYKAKGTSGSKPQTDMPRRYWGIDMTKFMISSIKWDISLRSWSAEWRKAMEMAIEMEFPEGVRGNGLKIISDNGSQPTSTSFMKDMATLGIEQIVTSYDNPKGNADTEGVMRTVKEEIIWLNEFGSFEEAKERIGKWIEIDYNKLYIHSELGYVSSQEFEEAYCKKLLIPVK